MSSASLITLIVVLTRPGIMSLAQRHERHAESKERVEEEPRGTRQRDLDHKAFRNRAGGSGEALESGIRDEDKPPDGTRLSSPS